MTNLICQTCGALWSTDEVGADLSRFYFASSSGDLEKPTSVTAIAGAGLAIVGCPKDPMPFDPSMGAPDPSTGLQPGRAPDSGERSPGPGDANAVHPPEED